MAQYLLSVHTADGEPREPMSEERMRELMERIGELEGEMHAAGALVHSGRLADAGSAKVVRAERDEVFTTDGPFVETKEHLGGFYIVEAKDLDEALSWGAKTAACIGRPIEVRPFVAARGG
jgi:hypothetical protein